MKILTHLLECGPVLLDAILRMGAQRATLGAIGMEPERIDLVVAKDRVSVAVFDHPAHRLEHFPDFWSSVDVVSHEDDLAALRVGVDSVSVFIAQLGEQGVEFVGVAVDVADDVVVLFRFHKARIAGFRLIRNR